MIQWRKRVRQKLVITVYRECGRVNHNLPAMRSSAPNMSITGTATAPRVFSVETCCYITAIQHDNYVLYVKCKC